MITLGTFLAWLFLACIWAVAALAIAGVLERYLARWRPKWRVPGSKLDNFLRRNAAIHGAMAEVAFAVLLAWALIDASIAGLNGFLAWTQAGSLASRAVLTVLFTYVFIVVLFVIPERTTEDAQPFLSRATNRVMAAFASKSDPELEATLNYSYGLRAVHGPAR